MQIFDMHTISCFLNPIENSDASIIITNSTGPVLQDNITFYRNESCLSAVSAALLTSSHFAWNRWQNPYLNLNLEVLTAEQNMDRVLQTIPSETSLTNTITDIAVIAIVSTVNEIVEKIDRTLQAGSYTELKLKAHA